MNPSDSRYDLLRFRFLIRNSRWPPHRRNGSEAKGNNKRGLTPYFHFNLLWFFMAS